MIVAFTDYEDDEVTTLLSSYAQNLLDDAGSLVAHVLAPPSDSDSSNIQVILARNQFPFFFFGHGEEEPPGLLGQDKTRALDSSNCDLLQDRFVCATCCWSIPALDQAVSNYNATILGYDGELAVILREPMPQR